jgi:hypothetical protein
VRDRLKSVGLGSESERLLVRGKKATLRALQACAPNTKLPAPSVPRLTAGSTLAVGTKARGADAAARARLPAAAARAEGGAGHGDRAATAAVATACTVVAGRACCTLW